MDTMSRLEERVDKLLHRIKSLEAENISLRKEMEKERLDRDAIVSRIDALLKRIQEEAVE